MKNAILVLANNMEYFNLMVKNIPDSIKDFDFIVVNETRIGDKTDRIKKILEESKISRFRVFTSDEINDKFKEEVIDNDFVDDYSMSMNILSLWFVYKYNSKIGKILLLDDDVILRDGFEKIFESDHHLFKSNRLSAGAAEFYGQSQNAIDVYKEWFRIFQIKFSDNWWKNEYLKKYANSGQRLIVRSMFDLDQYEKKLKEFFKSDLFYRFWIDRRNHVSWYFDERFETFFFFDSLNNELKDTTYLVLSKPEKLNDGSFRKMMRSSIIHNATNSHKKKVYNLMIERGIIQGDLL